MNADKITIKSNIKWGVRYRDTITGFEGVATGYTTYISGCDQVLLNGGMNKDNEKVVSIWFDADRLQDVATRTVPDRDRGLKGPDAPAPTRN